MAVEDQVTGREDLGRCAVGPEVHVDGRRRTDPCPWRPSARGCTGRRSRTAGDVGRRPRRPARSTLGATGRRRRERAAVGTEGEPGATTREASGGRIVVGVDGSPGGRAALVWALAAA